MVSNCASRLVSAGWQCMHIWLSSDMPVHPARPVLPRLSVSLETDNSLGLSKWRRSSVSVAQIVNSTAGSVTDICGTSLQSHFTHFVVVKQLCHSGRRVERRQVSDDVYIVGQKQSASDLFSRCEKDMKVVVALSSFWLREWGYG